MLKRISMVLLGIVMLLSLGACGVKEKINEKISEKISEGILEKVTGSEVDFDLDDGKLTIEGEDGEGEVNLNLDDDKLTIENEDGEEYALGGTEWPEGEAVGRIPEFKNGKIVSVMNSDQACLINVEDVEEKDYNQYVEEVKSRGFTEDAMDQTSAVDKAYVAKSNGAELSLMYSIQEKELIIAVGVQ